MNSAATIRTGISPPYLITAVFLIILVSLTGCERVVTGSEKAAVLAFSEATTDNLLAGLTANDYTQFSRDFDDELQAKFPPADFTTLTQDVDITLGSYLSRSVTQVTKADEFYVVAYQARFEQAEAVTITVAFHDTIHSIATWSIDSAEMSWSAFQNR